MYDICVHELAQRVLTHIRRDELVSAGERVGVAVSGGIDSVALLRLLIELRTELGTVLSVVHFNHKLRGAESNADEEFAAGLAREFGLEFYCDGEDTARCATEEHSSIEAAARELRYGFFQSLLEGTSGAEAPENGEGNRSAKSAAPPQSERQGLKPSAMSTAGGTTEVVPFPNAIPGDGAGVVSFPNAIPDEGVGVSPFANLAQPATRLNKICTGHTLDDQAETVLMRVIRGTGLRGLGAIHPRLVVQNEDEDGEVVGEIVRPLLGIRRAELEGYLKTLGQDWREDASNADDRFTRNRVRHMLMPLLEREFNPSVAQNLAELAELARSEEDYWENEAAGWMGTTVQWWEPDWAFAEKTSAARTKSSPQGSTGDSTEEHGRNLQASDLVQIRLASSGLRTENVPWLVMNASVSLMWLLGELTAVQRRIIKAVGQYASLHLEFKHVEEILRFAGEDGEAGKQLSLPQGWKVVRNREELVFLTPDLRWQGGTTGDYQYELNVPGSVMVAEASTWFEAEVTSSVSETADDCVLDAASLPGPLQVRNWRPGDRFWPAHTKAPKKVKELLQGRAAGPVERKLWPVIVSGDEIVWLRGFPVSNKFKAQPGRETIVITERLI